MSKFPALPLKLKNLLNTFARKQPNLVIFNIFIFDWSNYIIIYTCNLTPSVLIFERLVVYSSWNLNHGSAPFWLLGFGSSKKCGSTDPDPRCEISTKNCKNKKIQGTILFFFQKLQTRSKSCSTNEYCPVVGFLKVWKFVDLGPKTFYFWLTGKFPL